MKWIDADKELPKENGNYLCCVIFDDNNQKIVHEVEFYRCPEYGDSDWCDALHGDVICGSVTYWAEMPELPKAN